MSEEVKSHLFAIRTTGGQEKVVMRLLEAKANANQINIQSVFWVSDLKGYVVVEAVNPSDAYLAVEGVRHIRGQLRGELAFEDIEGYLVKKSTVLTLAELAADFEAHEATLVRIENITMSGGSIYSDFIDITDGTATFGLYTRQSASFANESIPSGAVTLTGIASQGGNSSEQQLLIRNLGDVVGGGSTGGNFDIVMSEDFSTATEFEDISLSNWTNFNEAGQLKWEARTYSDNPFASMSAFGSDDPENIAWLVTKSFALSNTSTLPTYKSVSF